LLRVVGDLAEAGIPCVVLKGTPLARRLHQGIDGRVVGDNDVLVRAEDARDACARLEREGYRPLPFLDLERRLRHTNQFLLSKRRDGVNLVVEVHWNAFARTLFRVPEQVQWAHTQKFVLHGRTFDVFDPALTLNHLAAHFVQHGFSELRILRELASAWNLWGREHGTLAFSLADTIGLRPALDYALNAAALLGLLSHELPPGISPRARVLLRLLPAGRLANEPALESEYARVLVPLVLADARTVPRSLAQTVFPPLDELASTYGKPIGTALYLRYISYWMRPIGRMLRAGGPS
jgi:hypothetical protein